MSGSAGTITRILSPAPNLYAPLPPFLQSFVGASGGPFAGGAVVKATTSREGETGNWVTPVVLSPHAVIPSNARTTTTDVASLRRFSASQRGGGHFLKLCTDR